jgi:hypothetical protein
MSDQFLQLAEAAVALMPRARGRRRVKVIKRGKKWVLYRVVRDMWLMVGYVDWIERYYSPYIGAVAYVKINLRDGCVAYNINDMYEAYKLSERDIAGLVEIRSVKDLWGFVWRRIKDGGEPCERSPLLL